MKVKIYLIISMIFIINTNGWSQQITSPYEVVFDESRNRYLVINQSISGSTTIPGSIVAIDSVGTMSYFVSPGGISGWGSAVIAGDSLYLSQNNELKEFNLTTGQLTRTFNTAGGAVPFFPSSLTYDPKTDNLYGGGNRFVRINRNNFSVNFIYQASAENLIFDPLFKRILYFVGPKLYEINPITKSRNLLIDTNPFANGITTDGKGKYFGRLFSIFQCDSSSYELKAIAAISYDYKLNFNRKDNLLLVPVSSPPNIYYIHIQPDLFPSLYNEADSMLNINWKAPKTHNENAKNKYFVQVSTNRNFSHLIFEDSTYTGSTTFKYSSNDTCFWRVKATIREIDYDGKWSETGFFLKNGTSGITPSFEQISCQIFPNPSAGDVNIVINDISVNSIEIYNAIGQKVVEEKVLPLLNESFKVNLKNTGFYFLVINTEKGTLNKKILIR